MRKAKGVFAHASRTALYAAAMASAVAHADLTVVSCDAPTGWRVDYSQAPGESDRKVQTGEDRLKRPKPLFVLDSDDPDTLLELLASAATQDISKEFIAGLTPKQLHRHQVVLRSDRQIAAVDVGRQAIYTISIYLRLGVAILTRASSEQGEMERGVGAI